MEFLKVLEKAKELGLTKEEFLPIYMQEVERKAANLTHSNSEWNMHLQSKTESDPNETPEPYNFQEWKERKPQCQQTQRESHQQFTEPGIQDLKSSLNNLKESLFSQFLNFTLENATHNESCLIKQEDIHNFLKQMYSDIKTILSYVQNDCTEQSSSTKLEILHKELLKKFEDHCLKLRSEIHQAHQEIISKYSSQNFSNKDENLTESHKHEELLMQQELQLEDKLSKLQYILQQGQTDHASMILNMTPILLDIFNKTCEFQNLVCAELQVLKRNQQTLLTNAQVIHSAKTSNMDSFQLLSGSIAYLQNQNSAQNISIINLSTKLEEMLNYLKATEQLIQNVERDKSSFLLQPFDSCDVSDNSLSSSQFPYSDFDVPFVCTTDSNGGIVSFVCYFQISNIKTVLESKKELYRVTYSKKLGCCLRARFSISDVEKLEESLKIILDICQVDTDVRLPNLLRISTEVNLVGSFDVHFKWIVAKESGVLNLPTIKGTGWFEISAAVLGLKNPELVKFLENKDILLNFNIIVLNGLENEINVNKDISFELSNDRSSRIESEYFDAFFAENWDEETGNEKMPEVRTDESVLQPLSLEIVEEDISAFLSHSSYLLPIFELSTLISSQTLIDSQDWYLQFLGHSIHAVLAFLDDDTLMICIDYFHGKVCANLPDFSVFRCRVTLVDRTDKMEDLVLGESMEMFDMTAASPPNWMDSCICMIHCYSIEERFKSKDTILLQFDFFELE